jgi:hypothetical protein
MKTRSCFLAVIRAGVLLLLLAAADACRAQYNLFLIDSRTPGSRAQRVDFYMLGQYWTADDATISGVTLPVGPGPMPPLATGDVVFEFDDSAFWGFGITYHLNKHFALNGEFTFGYPDYQASFNGSVLRGEAFVTTGSFNAQYNVLAGPVTPFISAGLGYFYIDSGIPSGPPGFYYWWDYWWGGYVVTVHQPTYDETWFTMNAQAGLRWDISDQFYLSAGAGANWVYVGNGAGWMTALQGTLQVGCKF